MRLRFLTARFLALRMAAALADPSPIAHPTIPFVFPVMTRHLVASFDPDDVIHRTRRMSRSMQWNPKIGVPSGVSGIPT